MRLPFAEVFDHGFWCDFKFKFVCSITVYVFCTISCGGRVFAPMSYLMIL